MADNEAPIRGDDIPRLYSNGRGSETRARVHKKDPGSHARMRFLAKDSMGKTR